MEIYVLLKQTFDTEEKIVVQQGAIVEEGVKFVINPYDEYAVEQAIQFRDDHGGKVTVLAVGPERMAEALRTALAMGADEAVLISDDRITGDEYAVSQVIHRYLSDKSFDMILGGSFSVDNGAGQVTIRLAKLLDIPHVSTVTKLDLSGKQVVAYRDSEGDLEVSDLTLPALFTAQQGLNEPRYPSLPGIMKAKKKPFTQLSLDDLGIDQLNSKTERTDLFLPEARKAGKILQGELSHQVKELVSLLRNESKVI